MKNVLKMFAVVAVCFAALTGTSYASTAKGKSSKKAVHHKSVPAKHVAEKTAATK